jgi:nitrogen fixation protein FixH
MKFTWGSGIVVVIILFLIACGAFIIYTTGQKWSLVEEDYYPKELKWEEKLVKMRNANSLTEQVKVSIDSSFLVVKFPRDFRNKPITGNINIYRPSDEKLDIHISIAADTAMVQVIPVSRLVHGKYIMKVDWQSGNRGFYREQEIFVY